MLTMIILGAGMAACGQVGPIDAFRLNFSAVQVQGHYTIRTGRTNYRLISEIEIGEPGSLRFDSSRWPATEGDWACNGAEEKYRFPVQFGGIEGRQDGGEEGLEVLYDGMKLAQRLDDTGVIDARGDGVFDAVYYGAKSPFHLFMMKFPELIGEVFADVIPEVAEMRIGRRSVSVESYVTGRTGAAAGWKRLDIYYDHEWNFIPVYARFTKYSETDDSAKIREHFVLRTHRCPGGGVVPAAWVESQVEIDNFQGSYPEFDAGVEVVSDAEIAAVVFEFECEDLSSDVLSFSEQPLNIVTTPGGPMSAKLMASRENITLEKLSKLAGGRLTTPSSDPLPNIDHDELNMHKGGTSHRSRIVVASGLIIAAGIGASLYALRRRSAGLMSLLVIQSGLLGCSGVDEAEIGARPRVVARFEEPYVLYEGRDDSFAATLLLSNEGVDDLTLFDVDGGCSCRDIDKSALPAVIAPGAQLGLGMTFTAKGNYEPERFQLKAETNLGTVLASASIMAFPRNKLSPTSAANGTLGEDAEWSFEVTHRSIHQRSEPASLTDIDFPERFAVTPLGSKSGRLAYGEGLVYEDASYRLTLTDKSLGTFKDRISLSKGGTKIVLDEVALLWERRPFLSTSPPRMILGPRPARAFLRCDDHTVELTEILDVPDGVVAVVSSTREVSAWLDEDARAKAIDGIIKVGTNAPGSPTLRLHAVRYVSESGATSRTGDDGPRAVTGGGGS